MELPEQVFYTARAEVCVPLRASDTHMSEDGLHHAYICAGLKQVRGACMAEAVRAKIADPSKVCMSLNDLPYGAPVKLAPGCRHKQLVGIHGASRL